METENEPPNKSEAEENSTNANNVHTKTKYAASYKSNCKKGADEQQDSLLIRFTGEPPNSKSVGAAIDDAGWPSFISFAWMFPWMWQAYKGRVNTDPSNGAQWKCSVFDSTNVNLKRLEHLWNEEIKRTSTATAQPQRPPSLFRTVLRFMRFRLALACLVFLFCIVFGFIGPTCLVRGLIAFTEKPTRYEADGTIDYSLGFYFAFSILVVEMMRVLAYGATWAISYRTAIRTRGAVLALLYKKLLNAKSLRGKSPAQVVNMFANDGQRIFDAVTFAPLVLVGPFVLIGGLIYLLRVIGPLSLLGVAVFFVFDIIQAGLGFALVKCRNLAIAQVQNFLLIEGIDVAKRSQRQQRTKNDRIGMEMNHNESYFL